MIFKNLHHTVCTLSPFLQIISFFSSSVTTFRFFINWLFIKGIVSRDSRCTWHMCQVTFIKKALLFSWFEASGLLVNRQNIFDIRFDLAKIFEILRKSAVWKTPRGQRQRLRWEWHCGVKKTSFLRGTKSDKIL